MGIESKIDDLITALDANTKALIGDANTKALLGGVKAESPKEMAKDEAPARGSRGRAAREEKRGADGPTEDEFKAAVAKFLDQPDTKEGDDEYNKRLEKVVDPIFDKAGVKELQDLPEKFWPDVLDGIKEYEKAADGGSRRNRR